MKSLLIKWLIMALALVIAATATKGLGLSFVADTGSAASLLKLVIGAVVLGLLNATLGRVLKFISLPLNCLTLGLFALVINAAIFYWVGTMGFGYKVGDFISAFVGSLFYSAITAILGSLVPDKADKD
ncbi:MAG: phage holin family protein [Armatimonadetes bacterium]|nr:phage holin family protein [Armatimonadota bacterium]